VKKDLKGQRFADIPAVQRASTRVSESIPKEDFQGAYEQWKSRWQRCVDGQGAYFEEFSIKEKKSSIDFSL